LWKCQVFQEHVTKKCDTLPGKIFHFHEIRYIKKSNPITGVPNTASQPIRPIFVQTESGPSPAKGDKKATANRNRFRLAA
jgi:hypothetical protein